MSSTATAHAKKGSGPFPIAQASQVLESGQPVPVARLTCTRAVTSAGAGQLVRVASAHALTTGSAATGITGAAAAWAASSAAELGLAQTRGERRVVPTRTGAARQFLVTHASSLLVFSDQCCLSKHGKGTGYEPPPLLRHILVAYPSRPRMTFADDMVLLLIDGSAGASGISSFPSYFHCDGPVAPVFAQPPG
jgi:hypothetical protein